MTTRNQSIYINPSTRDWEVEDGDLKMDTTQHSDIAFHLALEYGSSAVNPAAGNKIWTIRKLASNVPSQAEEYCRAAIQPRVDDGSVTNVEAAAETQHGWTLAWEVGYKVVGDEGRTLNLTAKDAVP